MLPGLGVSDLAKPEVQGWLPLGPGVLAVCSERESGRGVGDKGASPCGSERGSRKPAPKLEETQAPTRQVPTLWSGGKEAGGSPPPPGSRAGLGAAGRGRGATMEPGA